MGLRLIPPISTNTMATDFGASGKYANMININHADAFIITTCIMLLKALIVRSTTQKDIKLFRTRRNIDLKSARPGDVPLSLDGTDKSVAVAIEGT